MFKIFLSIFVYVFLATNLSALTIKDNSLSSNKPVYVYFVKNFFQGIGCLQKKDVSILFEFWSNGESREEFYRFIDNYISGMESNEWRLAYFPNYQEHWLNKCNKERKYFKSGESVIGGIPVFVLRKPGFHSECYFSKLTNSITDSAPDVSVRTPRTRGEKIVSYLDFTGDSREFNKIYKYQGSDKQYGNLVSQKIDESIYRDTHLKIRAMCP